jgi:serine/threonine protein kinase
LHGGRYRLIARLRDGASAQVWRGLDAREAREVALKAIPLDVGGAEAAEREAEAAARVRHPCVIRVHGTFTEVGFGFIVMDLAASSLADVVEVHGALDAQDTRAVAFALAEVLAATHAAGVVHRDIKPHNVLVMPDGSVRLADFGIARVHARGQSRTGALLGTLPYMAPEQRRDTRAVCPGTDLYAWGVLVAWMRTGECPGELYVPAAQEALRALLRGAGEPDDALYETIVHVGAYEPGDRPADGAALATMLRSRWTDIGAPCLSAPVEFSQSWRGDAVATPPATYASASPPTPPAKPRSPIRTLAGIGLGLALAAGTGAAVARWPWSPSPPSAPPASSASLPSASLSGASPSGADLAGAALPICDGVPRGLQPVVRQAPEETVAANAFDLDADGLQDAVYTNQLAASLTIWWGARSAVLAAPTNMPAARSHAAAQLYAYGSARELLLPLPDASTIARWSVTGRTFTPMAAVEQPGTPTAAAVVNWDGDDVPDLLVETVPCVMFRRGDGAGGFEVGRCAALRAGVHVVGAVQVGDRATAVLFDADGGFLAHGGADGTSLVREAIAPGVPLPRTDADGEVYVAQGPILQRWTRTDAVFGTPGAWSGCTWATDNDGDWKLFGAVDADQDGTPEVLAARTCAGCTSNQTMLRAIR